MTICQNYFLVININYLSRVEEEAHQIIVKLPETLQNDILKEQHEKVINSWSLFRINFSNELLNKMQQIVKE